MTRVTSAIEPSCKYRLDSSFLFFFFFFIIFLFLHNSSYYFSPPENTGTSLVYEMQHQSHLTFTIVSKVPSTTLNGSDDAFKKIKQIHARLLNKTIRWTKCNVFFFYSFFRSSFLIIKLYSFFTTLPTFKWNLLR